MAEKAGYKRPPIHTRFQKGHSGNPGGQPGPRRAMERRLQCALETALRGPPAGLVPEETDTLLALTAKQLVLGCVRADAAACNLMMSFLSERGCKRPRRVRLACGLLDVLVEASEAESSPPAPAANGGPSQGITNVAQRSEGIMASGLPLQEAPDSGRDSQGITVCENRSQGIINVISGAAPAEHAAEHGAAPP